MATFTVDYFIDIGTGGPHDATTWKVYKDKEKTILLDQSIKDEVNLTKWKSPIPKEDGSGDFYYDLKEFYVEIQIHANGHTSDPFLLGPFNQLDEVIKITDGSEVTTKTTKELGWWS